MQMHQLKPAPGSRKQRKRLGRGDSSGHGSFSGRGMKGQKSRSGGGVRPGFEGGQLPLAQALPKMRGFTNIFRVEYSAVNLDRLVRFPANTEVTPEMLVQTRVLRNLNRPVKILGRGELAVSLAVTAQKFSASAREKIEAVGGSVREIG